MRPRVVVPLCAVTVVAFAALMTATSAYAAYFLPDERLTPAGAVAVIPAISGTRVAYADLRNGNWDIYVYDLSTHSEKRLTTHAAEQSHPDISGSRVVWQDLRNGNWDIYAYDLSSNTEKRLTTGSTHQVSPAISGSKVVWVDGRGGSDAYTDVYLYDFTTSATKRLTRDTAVQEMPAISGTHVVYGDARSGMMHLYLYDLSTSTEKPLPTVPGYEAYYQTFPAISGQKIVFSHKASNTLAGLGLYDISTGKATVLTDLGVHLPTLDLPSISGSRIVGFDAIGNKNVLFDLDTSETYRLRYGLPGTSAGWADISGTRIVNQDIRTDDMDIFLTEIVAPRLTVSAPSIVNYGSTAKITGALVDASGVALVGATVTLQSSKSGTTWSNGTTTVTGPGGAYAISTRGRLASSSYFRALSARDSEREVMATVSGRRLVRPTVSLTSPSAPAAVRARARFTSTGYLRPRHRAGSYPVKLQVYGYEKQASGSYTYVLKQTISARASDYSSYTKYSATVVLPSAGWWRVCAYHAPDTDNAATSSGWRYIQVQ